MTDRHDELRQQLDALTAAVKEAVDKRTAWLDEHMVEVSKFKIGDGIYNIETGARLGTISAIKRHWAGDANHDDSLGVYHEYLIEGESHCYDNTSRQRGITRLGTLDEMLAEMKRKAAWAVQMAEHGGDEDAMLAAAWGRVFNAKAKL